jgi:hypothetical protein
MPDSDASLPEDGQAQSGPPASTTGAGQPRRSRIVIDYKSGYYRQYVLQMIAMFASELVDDELRPQPGPSAPDGGGAAPEA